jgi:hypothetical protein
MKKSLIILVVIFAFTLVFGTSYAVIELQTKYGELVLRGNQVELDSKKFMEKHNILAHEFEDILIPHITNTTKSLKNLHDSQAMAILALAKISQSDRVINVIDSVIKSPNVELYFDAINAFFYINLYSTKTLTKIEEYIKLTDKSSDYRRTRFYVRFSYAIDTDDTLSVDIKFQIIKLMLKYLTYDLSNWKFLDEELCEKIPSYRHSIQRKNMIEYIQSKEANLTEWYRGELSKILEDFNLAIKEKPLIDLSDEIIREEIKTYKCTKYEVWEI